MSILNGFYFGVLVFSLGMGIYFGVGVGLINLGAIVAVTEGVRGFLSYLESGNGHRP